ncbi:hypothetical protein PSEUBRA_002120 [Kalmanozyma brasiliensis GHG001]|uniref:uncharacterized protein n=1 Tax=Kalmanozyma brasiliensis (strain GHG001) TaxID=1365824 RepID=UPI001CEA5436|nr:uncharacterized protein PSEUBRA_002120 [Kalmanozyma brasiliensis GHG001]KAF6767043.1 hypothetical protein PSEUBRA_002120 [Kalmanozyma brasiliensis GHG001]
MVSDKTMTIRLHLRESVDVLDVAKELRAAREQDEKPRHVEIIHCGHSPDMDDDLKKLAENGVEEVDFYVADQVLCNGVDVAEDEDLEVVLERFAQDGAAPEHRSGSPAADVPTEIMMTINYRLQKELHVHRKCQGVETADVGGEADLPKGDNVVVVHGLKYPKMSFALLGEMMRGQKEIDLIFAEKVLWDGVVVPAGGNMKELFDRGQALMREERVRRDAAKN